MAQRIRWYLMPLTTMADGRLRIPPAIRNTLQGFWVFYRLPGDAWALVRVRGEELQHTALAALPGTILWPRGRTERWDVAAPQRLQNRLTELGITIAGNPWPDEALDQVGQAHQNYAGGYSAPWSRLRERRLAVIDLDAVED